MTQIVNSTVLTEKPVVIELLKIIGVEKQLPIGFGSALAYNNLSKVLFSSFANANV